MLISQSAQRAAIQIFSCSNTYLGMYRPPRLQEIYLECPLYFVTTNVHERQTLLCSNEVHQSLLEEWLTTSKKYSWHIGPYVVMPDHIHMICWPLYNSKAALAKFIGKWKEYSSKRLGPGTSPLWQEGFFDRLLRDDAEREDRERYMDNNPYTANLVEMPTVWPFKGVINDYPFNTNNHS